jgi:dipeptidyl aminopeptidase/acylaminoacyl peptidase
LLVSLGTGLSGLALDDTWTPELQMKFKTIPSTAISADGKLVAYVVREPIMEEEKEKRDVILVDQNFKNSHIYTVTTTRDAEGNRKTERVTEGDFQVNSLDWSPDGLRIVFAHQPDPRINTRDEQDISTISADGGSANRLVVRPGVDSNPLFSPDGKWIGFTSSGGKPEPIGLGDVYVVPAGGGTPKKLVETPDRSGNLLAWSQDGRSIYVLESARTSSQVLAVPLEGDSPRAVATGDGVFRAVSVSSSAGEMAFTYEELEEPVEVYRSSVGELEMKRLSEANQDVPRPPMGRTEVVSWTSTGGFEIEGLLTYPVGYEAGKSYPLVLNVHGGPAGVYSQRFTGNPGIYMIQTFAQQGYAVLRPNPRGSSGYGKDFRFANFKDWGFGDYDDLMAGVDKAIEMGVADPQKLFLMGWSYGGYMTSFMVTRTHRFKAASMGAGLPNLLSMVTTTDIPNYLAAHMGGEFWDDYETYEKHSAMYRIKNVTIPTQVIHGAQDLRVPFTQGQEFYVALSRRGVPTEMIVYPRTPHGPREPKLLMDVTPRILAWFEKHSERQGPTE